MAKDMNDTIMKGLKTVSNTEHGQLKDILGAAIAQLDFNAECDAKASAILTEQTATNEQKLGELKALFGTFKSSLSKAQAARETLMENVKDYKKVLIKADKAFKTEQVQAEKAVVFDDADDVDAAVADMRMISKSDGE